MVSIKKWYIAVDKEGNISNILPFRKLALSEVPLEYSMVIESPEYEVLKNFRENFSKVLDI